MSFILEYRPLFSITVADATTGDPLEAFFFAPDDRTRKLLQNHQLVCRIYPTGLVVYYQVNPLVADPLLGRIADRIRLSFLVTLRVPDLFARFEPTLTNDTGPQLYLDNLTETGAIQAPNVAPLSAGNVVQAEDAMQLYPQTFRVSAELTGAIPPSKFIVRDKFDPARVVLEAPIAANGNPATALVAIDLTAEPAGPFTLETDVAGSPRKTIYADDDLAGSRLVGLVDIYWETAQDSVPADGIAYLMRLQRR